MTHGTALLLFHSSSLPPSAPPTLRRAIAATAVYDGGNLWDHVQQQRQQWHASDQGRHALAAARDGAAARRRQEQQLERVREALEVFLQVCAALHSMHSMEPPLAHRDVKPQNVLLRRRPPAGVPQSDGPGGIGVGQAGGSRSGGYGPVPALLPLEEQQQQEQEGRQQQQQPWNVGEWRTSEGGAGQADGSAVATASTAAAVIAVVDEEGDKPLPPQQQQQRQQPDEQWWQRRLEVWRQRGLEAVLMDFGSTRAQPVVVRNRSEAMVAQEDAEVGGRCMGVGVGSVVG